MAAPLNPVTLVVPSKLDPIGAAPFNVQTICDQGTIVASLQLDVPAALCAVVGVLGANSTTFFGSRLFVDYMGRTLMKTQPLKDLRTYLACCVNALIQVGVPDETLWPYVSTNYDVAPSAICFGDAVNHKLLTYMNLTNAPEQLKTCLSLRLSFTLGIVVYQSWSTDKKVIGTGIGDGTGLIYQNAGDTVVSNMMVNIWAWDDTKSVWNAQACRGNQGLPIGNFLIPYSYLSNAANIVTDIWALQTVAKGPPVPCGIGSWGTWAACTPSTCGTTGTQTQTRTNVPPTNGGTACPSSTKTQPCTNDPCPQNCTVTDWGNQICTKPATWTKACGWTGGTETMTRSVIQNQAFGGTACPSLTMTSVNTCDGPSCPSTDCGVSDWSAYGTCDATKCGTVGNETSTRTIMTPPLNGGAACPALTQTMSCDAPDCPVDCQVSDWSDWGACSSKNCGTPGTKTKTLTVITPASNGGQACPTLTKTKVCNPLCTTEVAVIVLIIVMVLLIAMGIALMFW